MLTILMSIKPYFANRILDGLKKYEFRRKIFYIPSGSRIIVYASSPVKAIIGEFTAGRIYLGKPEEIWQLFTSFPNSGIEEKDWDYIKGNREVLAIEVVKPIRYPNPLTLNFIRSKIPYFRPPQSYMRIRVGDPLLDLIKQYAYKGTKRTL